ncbi:MAG TPA: Gfo/Idh/MocA family oxidoreductase [Bryobacteraceae bacterium]|nr:Gfo/Idh/MocA family oxidoreductase [Bryobacteraceae bacterium]
MKNINRRNFLKTTLATAAAVNVPFPSITQEISPSDEIRVAVIGFNGRGRDHISGFSNRQGVRLTALCDADSLVLEREVKKHQEKGLKLESFKDARKLLESKNIDAVSIATPNHWHALMAIWAIQAGKDVYVEKPISHNVWEGRKVVEAARKYQRIVQAGTQSRSSQAIKDAVAWVAAGNIGKIEVSRGLCYKPRASIGKTEGPQKVPDNIDYDLWSGPAPLVPSRRNSKQFGPVHYDWHWIWNYGNGDLGNQGIHQMDIARWFLGVNELSPRVFSVGGRLGYEDDGETPNTQMVYHGYEKAPLIFEVRGLPEKTGSKNMDKYKGGSVAVVVECEGGYVLVGSNYGSAVAFDKEGKQIQKWEGGVNHYQNFIEAVRSRKQSELNADIWEGHLSSALCHTGNISYRLGKAASPGQIKEQIKGDKNATETFERMAQHLAANDVDLEKSKATMGVPLLMDPKVEKFIGNSDADAMLTREYRKPFVVPERV